jgi:dTDP-4-amino-4,6-dideoxygalactose transaminase
MNPSAAEVKELIPALDLKAQYASIREEVRAAVNAVLDAQHFILGPEVQALEKEVPAFLKCGFGVGVASGTDALILALKACGIGPGDEVLCPSFTYIATADSVSLLGAVPVFVDIEPKTFTMDSRKIEERITPRTKAIIPVHLYGQAADMDTILEIARRRNLRVIEDNAQAIGSTHKGKYLATIGDIGCLSFFPSKNLGACGDGGMVVTNSEKYTKRLRSLRAHGSTKKYFSEEQGWNSRLDEMQAAILRVKLRHLNSWSEGRRTNAAHYDTLLKTIPGVVTPPVANWGTHVFHQYTIRVPRRDHVQKVLLDRGIASTVYYPWPIHLQPLYQTLGHKQGDFPETERACEEALSLPIYPELTEQQLKRVADAIVDALRA